MQNITAVTGTAIPLLLDDIDTDRIIPAKYLKCVTFDGLGDHVFEDDRDQDPNHPFDDKRFQSADILITGRNFGCGSSREHAPQSLMRWGIQAVVGESFAEIFFGNCTLLGLPAVRASRSDLEEIGAAVQADPDVELTVDLTSLLLQIGDRSIAIQLPDGARDALTTGRWDFLDRLLEASDNIHDTAESIPYLNGFPADTA